MSKQLSNESESRLNIVKIALTNQINCIKTDATIHINLKIYTNVIIFY